MNDLNMHRVMGNVGTVKTSTTEAGVARAAFTVATNNRWTDDSGQRQERVQWHNVSAWGKTAELVGEFVKAGMKVYVEGPSETREYQNKDGVKMRATEIVLRGLGGERLDFLSRPKEPQPS